MLFITCLLLLLLSRFSRVRLCATPQTAAHQAPPPSLGFSRQEHWSGLPFPSPMHESESEVAQLYPTLSNPMDCSLPGSSIHGIFQARVLEWGAIAFSVAPNPASFEKEMQNFPVPTSKQMGKGRERTSRFTSETVHFLWKQLCELHTQMPQGLQLCIFCLLESSLAWIMPTAPK